MSALEVDGAPIAACPCGTEGDESHWAGGDVLARGHGLITVPPGWRLTVNRVEVDYHTIDSRGCPVFTPSDIQVAIGRGLLSPDSLRVERMTPDAAPPTAH